MDLVNNILKERLSDKKNIKNRYLSDRFYHKHKFIYDLDNINYCLYYKFLKFKVYGFKCYWFKNGKHHRDLGDLKPSERLPAIIYNITKKQEWYINGERHRDDDEFGNPQPALVTNSTRNSYFKNNLQFYPLPFK